MHNKLLKVSLSLVTFEQILFRSHPTIGAIHTIDRLSRTFALLLGVLWLLNFKISKHKLHDILQTLRDLQSKCRLLKWWGFGTYLVDSPEQWYIAVCQFNNKSIVILNRRWHEQLCIQFWRSSVTFTTDLRFQVADLWSGSRSGCCLRSDFGLIKCSSVSSCSSVGIMLIL